MSSGTMRSLTARQRAVMERIDRRIPIKVIALELGVSETRINQHIRALKDIYGAASLFELVDNYRLAEGLTGDDHDAAKQTDDGSLSQEHIAGEPLGEALCAPLSEPAYNKKQITGTYSNLDEWSQDNAARLVVGDVMPLAEHASWLSPGEPRVVPGLLEGEHAVPLRILAMILIAAGILAAVVLTVTAAMALSNALDGKADLPMDQWTGTD